MEVEIAMLIHSVTPLHLLTENPAYPQMSIKPFDGGYVEGYDTEQGFQISRLNSTDPSLYLKSGFMPGGIYK